MGVYRRQKMSKERSRGHRTCQICENPIKKGQVCFSIRIPGPRYYTAIHIHKSHIRPVNPNKCSHRMECISGEYNCKNYNCKLHKQEIREW